MGSANSVTYPTLIRSYFHKKTIVVSKCFKVLKCPLGQSANAKTSVSADVSVPDSFFNLFNSIFFSEI